MLEIDGRNERRLMIALQWQWYRDLMSSAVDYRDVLQYPSQTMNSVPEVRRPPCHRQMLLLPLGRRHREERSALTGPRSYVLFLP